MNNLDQYAYSLTLVHKRVSGDVEYPIRVIADTSDGMLVEREDMWAAIGETFNWYDDRIKDEAGARMIASILRSKFIGFSGMEVVTRTRPNSNGAFVTIHLKVKGGKRMHRMYFTWATTLARRLPEENLVKFADICAHVGGTFLHEFEWDEEEYQGTHRDMPITLFARGAQMGICKVHVDIPNKPQKVFRGGAKRLVDMVIQAKAYYEANL